MKHVLLIGVGPLPFYESNKLYGFGIRAWQFALPMLRAGHRVTLAVCEFGVSRETDLNRLAMRHDPSIFGDAEHIPLPEPNPRNAAALVERLAEIVRANRPDVIVAAGSTIATNLAASIKTDLPVWMDMFGDLFAEVQAKSPFIRDDAQFSYFHQVMTRVFLRGDRFSVVSDMQKGAAAGQLGLMGRLNRHTLGEELVHTIPCAMNGEVSPVRGKPILRGKRFSSADYLLLCSGGFNTWADVDTLFYGIEGAMEKNPRVHCVITGGSIQGHHEDGFKRFMALASKSLHESRFHSMGWVTNEEVAQITLECDMGINVDLPIYESMLGSRNRILYWMQCGLPVLTTVNTEIAKILVTNDLALGAPTGGVRQIAAAILESAARPGPVRAMAARARRMAYENFTFEESVRPLLGWVNHPAKAGDNVERIVRNGQPFSDVDRMLSEWAFEGGARNGGRAHLPRTLKPVIKTRPQGKNWWRRLIGS